MALDKNTIPQVLYNTPDPLWQPSELYVINGVILETAMDPIKRWVVKEEHGFWDEQDKAFKNRATTLRPTDPTLCVSREEVLKQVEQQVMRRVREGFKYQFEWYPYEPPFYERFEIHADGTRRKY